MDRYEIVERIGVGGMAAVYRAFDRRCRRYVALKVPTRALVQHPDGMRRFANEAKACARINHPNGVYVYDLGHAADGTPFLVMELLEGPTLTEVIQDGAPLPPQRVLRILEQCCAVLGHAHAAGIVHRDVKPENIFLLGAGNTDHVKMLDFSIARFLYEAPITRAGQTLGTPFYMAPEQCLGAPVDGRTDLYSLGVLGYELLTGRPPFVSTNVFDVLLMHQKAAPPPLPPWVPAPIRALLECALEKDPARRPPSAGAMRAACTTALHYLASSGELTRSHRRAGAA